MRPWARALSKWALMWKRGAARVEAGPRASSRITSAWRHSNIRVFREALVKSVLTTRVPVFSSKVALAVRCTRAAFDLPVPDAPAIMIILASLSMYPALPSCQAHAETSGPAAAPMIGITVKPT